MGNAFEIECCTSRDRDCEAALMSARSAGLTPRYIAGTTPRDAPGVSPRLPVHDEVGEGGPEDANNLSKEVGDCGQEEGNDLTKAEDTAEEAQADIDSVKLVDMAKAEERAEDAQAEVDSVKPVDMAKEEANDLAKTEERAEEAQAEADSMKPADMAKDNRTIASKPVKLWKLVKCHVTGKEEWPKESWIGWEAPRESLFDFDDLDAVMGGSAHPKLTIPIPKGKESGDGGKGNDKQVAWDSAGKGKGKLGGA